MSNNRSLKTLFIFNGIFVFAGSFLGPLYAIYVEKFDASIFSISLTWTAYLISTFAFSIFVSKIGDKIKENEYLLIAGFVLRGIAWLLFVFSGSIYHFILLQVIVGIGEALGTPAFDAIFAEHLNKGEHIKEYSDWKIISNATTAIGTLIGGMIVTLFGFNYMFVLMSLLAFISGIGLYLQPRRLL